MIILSNEESMSLNAQLLLGTLNMNIGCYKLFSVLKYIIFIIGLALYYTTKSVELPYKAGTTLDQMQTDRFSILFIFTVISIACLVAQLMNRRAIVNSLREHWEDIVFYLKNRIDGLNRYDDFMTVLNKCYKYAPKEVTDIKNVMYSVPPILDV